MDHRNLAQRARSKAADYYSRLAEEAARRGYTLLSPQWEGAHHDYLFRCERGHQFARRATVMARGTATCLECVQNDVRHRFLETLARRGIVNRDGEFRGLRVRHRFACSKGHEWTTAPRKIMEGSGCPACGVLQSAVRQSLPDGLERLHAAATARGGKCLADVYRGMRANYQWECARGHCWRATGARVTDGSWCLWCFARRNGDARLKPDGIARLKAIAAARGGQCLDDLYVRNNERYRFRCARGHEWVAHGNRIVAGSWCKRCASQKLMHTIGQMQEIARERGGRCLSEEYLGSKVRLTWECGRGHVWETAPANVAHQGTWCPNCAWLRQTSNPVKRKRYDYEGRE